MTELSKFLWTVAGLALAGLVGYGVASYAIGDLNKRVLDAAQNLGKVQAGTERLEKDNNDLSAKAKELLARNSRLETDIREIEARLVAVLRSDSAKLVGAIDVLNRSPDVMALTQRIQAAEAKGTTLADTTSSKEGCLLFEGRKLQVCWGTQELASESHIRRFNIKFPQAFATPPSVIPGINTASDGPAPAIYQFDIKESTYSGAVNNMHELGKLQTGKVFLSYVAIGVPGK